MKKLLINGSGLAFILTFIFVPIPDIATKGTYGLMAVVVYAVIAAGLALKFPKLPEGRKSLWIWIGVPILIAVIIYIICWSAIQRRKDRDGEIVEIEPVSIHSTR